MPARTPRLHLHLENVSGKAGVFHMTAERYAHAARRHRDLAGRINVTIGWDGDILSEALRSADVFVGSTMPREGLRAKAPQLKWIHVPSAGIEALTPLDWLPRDIVLTNNRGVHGHKAGQYVRMALTMLHTRMPEILANQRHRRWRQVFSPSLGGQTAVVVGLGDLGRAAARAAKSLGLKVIAVRRHRRKSRFADRVCTMKEIDRVLPQADFVVLAVPLTPETRNLLDRRRLDLLKPSAGVINIARAAVADYEALREKLEKHELAGAVLDVFPEEPLPPASPLWDTPNLVVTPHISCDDAENYVALTLDLVFENLGRLLHNKPLRNRVDPKLGY